MTAPKLLLLLAGAGALAACAITTPKELLDAREAYRRASTGPAATAAPADVHAANLALAKAEQAYGSGAEPYVTLDLAYAAQRKAETAEAHAWIVIDNRQEARAKEDFQSTQGKIVAQTKEDLSQTQSALAASERSGTVTTEQLSAERVARANADRRTAEAQLALANMASVKSEPRGLVISLAGSVFFASNRAVLLPEARARLGKVAAVLLTTRERSLTVEGHTDTSESTTHANDGLSQKRADAVRDYLVEQGYEAGRIQAHGLGQGHPTADNGSSLGRAANRRVEIVIDREQASN